MGLVNLFYVASMPVLKVLLITALGSFLALDCVDILGESARKQFNNMVFFVFNPALVGSNLAKTLTLDSISSMWFLPLNILFTFIIGSVFGWILVKITKAPQHLKSLVIGACSAGNLGYLLLIVIPAICKEKGSPLGAPATCATSGIAYASLSMAIGSICTWTYVYNIVRMSSSEISAVAYIDESTVNQRSTNETSETLQRDFTEPSAHSEDCSSVDLAHEFTLPSTLTQTTVKDLRSERIKKQLRLFSKKIKLKEVLTPTTIGAIAGFFVAIVAPVQKLMVGAAAPLHVIEDSALLIGDATIPTATLIVGGNLLKGLKGPRMRPSIIIGVVSIRYIFLPLSGILVVKAAIHFGLVHPDPLYEFILLLQFAVPPAMNIGTITQLFGAGESECSVILLFTYLLASVSLTLWSTFFLWLVS